MYSLVYPILILILILTIYTVFSKVSYDLPKIIWSFWDDDMPALIKSMLKFRMKNLPQWQHIHLNANTFRNYISEPIPARFDELKPAHKADWIRLALLKEHGGCWMDCGIIVNRQDELNDMYRNAYQSQSEFTGFYLEKEILNNNITTFIENWFLLAPKKSRLIHQWYTEYTHAIDIGFDKYKRIATNSLIPVNHIYKLYDTYLTQHVCLQIALHKINPVILLYKAEDSMMKLRQECQFNSECIMKKIRDEKGMKQRLPFIKLTSGERDVNIDISNYFQ